MKSYNTNKTTIYGVGNPGTAVEQAQKRAGIKIVHTNYIYKYVIETRVFVYKVCRYNKTIITGLPVTVSKQIFIVIKKVQTTAYIKNTVIIDLSSKCYKKSLKIPKG